ncbi:efflux transporter outer membrane subunit [Ramlibacter sp.]|uniref:efflux transporter outer membrane subunit n=1 Tax=Ramlibacter sp. TaxID=1917967 RepID=UPI0026106169|nr:efflux transporter outer membrane subunit [Ramlibacter sp.]
MFRCLPSALSAATHGLVALALCACSAGPMRQPEAVAPGSSFRHAPSAAAAQPAPPLQQDAWWKAFGDPTLDELEARAATGSTSIQAAAARLARARALVRSTDAASAPLLAVKGGAGRQGGPLINAIGGQGTLFSGSADLSYEVDLFGRLQQATDAASLDAQGQQALLRDAQLLVQADVAQNYLALRALDAERALVQGTAAAYRETLAITERRFRGGSVAELEWVRAQAEVAAIESDALALERRRTQVEHALAVLTGASASLFALPPQDWTSSLPAIPAGLPDTVLARRPDVAAARRAIEAAQTRLGLARTAWLPQLTLTASGGTASPTLVNVLQASSQVWSIGALLGATVFDGGRRKAGIQLADADLESSLVSYREHVLVALRDVEDQLSALQLLAGQAQAQSAAVTLGSRAALLADSRYRSGLASQLDVLDARRTELRNRREALQVRSEQYQATVRLIRALGGGWEAASAADRPPANP